MGKVWQSWSVLMYALGMLLVDLGTLGATSGFVITFGMLGLTLPRLEQTMSCDGTACTATAVLSTQLYTFARTGHVHTHCTHAHHSHSQHCLHDHPSIVKMAVHVCTLPCTKHIPLPTKHKPMHILHRSTRTTAPSATT